MAIQSKLFLGSLVAATTLSAFILSSTTVNAETYTKSALIRVSSACTMSGAVATAHTATVNGGTYTPDIGESVLTTVCNDSGGFAVYAIGFTNDTDGNNAMEHSTNPSATIATGTATSGQTSNWAMKLTPHQNGDNTPTIENGYDSYSVVPSDYIKVASYPSATAESASVSFKTYYAVYVSHQQTSGTYNGKVKYVMVHPSNGPAPIKQQASFDGVYASAGKTKIVTSGGGQYYALQDMTSAICDAIITPTAADDSDTPKTQLIDTRDNKIYWVAKLKDGKCWMTQNLDLDLEATAASVAALTSENTDLNTYGFNGYDSNNGYNKDANSIITWTPERSTTSNIISSSGSIPEWEDDDHNPYSVDPGNWYWTDTWYASTNNNYLRGNVGSPAKFQKNKYTGNGTHGHVGNYYNWAAAVASNDASSYATRTYDNTSNNPQNSICPKGWRLPVITSHIDGQQGDNDFYNLVNKYGNATNTDVYITASPAYFVRGGNISTTSTINELLYSGNRGIYWSSTVEGNNSSGDTVVYNFIFRSSSVNFENRGYGGGGLSIRCIAR